MKAHDEYSLRTRLFIILPLMLHLVFLYLVLVLLFFKGVFDFLGDGKELGLSGLTFFGCGVWVTIWAHFAERQYREQRLIGKIRRILVGW